MTMHPEKVALFEEIAQMRRELRDAARSGWWLDGRNSSPFAAALRATFTEAEDLGLSGEALYVRLAHRLMVQGTIYYELVLNQAMTNPPPLMMLASADPVAHQQAITDHAAESESTKQLMRFYSVDSLEALIDAQCKHIEGLQAKLPPLTPSFAPTFPRG